MTTPPNERLRSALAAGHAEQAIAILQQMEPSGAADLMMELPFEEQQTLFRKIPTAFAATLVGAFPYYHAYVLLHSRPLDEMNEIVDKMTPGERIHFFDELPEEAWQHLMDELAEKEKEALTAPPVEEKAPPAAPVELPIIEARGIEKVFTRPGGGQVQVIAPTDLSVEAGEIVALLGPSGSGKSTLLRILTGLTQPSAGEVLWHGKPLRETSPHVAMVFQSFALFPWLTVLDNVEAPLLARSMPQEERQKRANAAAGFGGPAGL